VISVRRAVSDADLEAWRQVRIEVLPNERAASVEDERWVESEVSLEDWEREWISWPEGSRHCSSG
jgi:hypothetical protein